MTDSNTSPALPDSRWIHRTKVALALWLIALVIACLVLTRHWPLVNDGALQHYISFLMDSGLAPFRQISDMNLPGSLMIDWTVVHALGGGPIAWRVFDALLMLAASFAMLVIALPYDWFAGVAAAALFWLLHARDGMGQTGQRDLMEATLLLLVTASAFHAVRSRSQGPFALAALCAGIAVTIKPDSLLLSALILTVALTHNRHAETGLTTPPTITVIAFCLPVAAAIAFLLHHHALTAFFRSLTEVTPYYARLGRQGTGELLRDCLSTPMRVLLVIAVLLAVTQRHRWTWERTVLVTGVTWGLASFFLQGKGYLYHRYPTLAFLLLWSAIECAQALQTPALLRVAGAGGLLYASLFVAPLSLVRASRVTWSNPLLDSLQADLTRLGGSSLAGNLQCIDSISGCNTVLYRMHLPEETGMLSDFLLFGPPTEPAVRRARSTFWSEINARPPKLIVVTGWLHPAGLDNYAKLALWPDFATFLNTRYTLTEQRSFPPGSNGPLSYRIYTLR